MNSRALALALLLVLGTTLSEVNARYIEKREAEVEARRDWLVIPDAIASAFYDYVKDISQDAAEALEEFGKLPLVKEIRQFLMKNTAAITDFVDELKKEIQKELDKEELDGEKKKKKRKKDKEHGHEKEEPQVAQEAQ